MRVWLYYRLSRDEDEELNSLTNQRKIIYDYAVAQGYDIVGESFDDNVSGMHFNREGIDKIYDAVEQGLVDGIQEFVERHGIHGDVGPPTIPYPEVAVDEEECTVRVTDDLLVLRLGDDTIEIHADRLTLVGKMFIQG